MGIIWKYKRSGKEEQMMTFESAVPKTLHDKMNRARRRGNDKSLYDIPHPHYRRLMCSQATLKFTFKPPMIKRVNQVKWMDEKAKHDWRMGYFGSATFRVRSSYIPQSTLAPSFLLQTNERFQASESAKSETDIPRPPQCNPRVMRSQTDVAQVLLLREQIVIATSLSGIPARRREYK